MCCGLPVNVITPSTQVKAFDNLGTAYTGESNLVDGDLSTTLSMQA